MMKFWMIFIFLTGLFLVQCSRDRDITELSSEVPSLPEVPYDYVSEINNIPAHLQVVPLNFLGAEPSYNPTTNWGVTLGRVLFYDKKLSANNTVSCGSCHHQENGFADNRRFSEGFSGGFTTRQSMALVNLRFSRTFFWDLRANGLENQVIMPVLHPVEMGMDTSELVHKLQSTSYYPELFEKAFGSSHITVTNIRFALAQFLRALVSYRSRFDEGLSNGFASFSPLEEDGRELFFSGEFSCNHCHSTYNFYERQALNNGLDSVYSDSGRVVITGDLSDLGKFRTPSLRNIAVTAPYMHDGRFATLAEVIEHYNSGIMPGPTLDDRLTTNQTIGGPPRRMNMTAYEKEALIAFLQTLTDDHFLSDPRYSDPFVH